MMTNTTLNPMSKRLPVFIISKPKRSPAFGPLFVVPGDRLAFCSRIAYRHGRISLVCFANLGNFYFPEWVYAPWDLNPEPAD